MKKILLNIFILLILTNCGFSPIYKEKNSLNYNINILKVDGDPEINQFILNKIKKYSGESYTKKYDININSEFSKMSLAKDNTGRTSDFKLSSKITISVNYEDKNQKYVFNESINIKNDTDSFEQRTYEKTIKENFAFSAVNKLIIKISSLK